VTADSPTPVPAFSDLRHLKHWGIRVLGPLGALAVVVPILLWALGATPRAILLVAGGLAALLVACGIVIALTTRLPRAA
jgi:hypothetical protein